MSKQPSPAQLTAFPEFAVRREIIGSFFHPPLASSTFHDLVNKGTIVPMKGIRGLYKLNESLKRLGLRELSALPVEATTRSTADILRLAFTTIDPVIFPAPSWILTEDELDPRDADHARLLAGIHREAVLALPSFDEKVAYFGGVLDAQALIGSEMHPGDR
ncbi:MAG: hypothetical protein ABIT37_22380 [Luteolibacter sp.]